MTGVQTCALPISACRRWGSATARPRAARRKRTRGRCARWGAARGKPRASQQERSGCLRRTRPRRATTNQRGGGRSANGVPQACVPGIARAGAGFETKRRKASPTSPRRSDQPRWPRARTIRSVKKHEKEAPSRSRNRSGKRNRARKLGERLAQRRETLRAKRFGPVSACSGAQRTA